MRFSIDLLLALDPFPLHPSSGGALSAEELVSPVVVVGRLKEVEGIEVWNDVIGVIGVPVPKVPLFQAPPGSCVPDMKSADGDDFELLRLSAQKTCEDILINFKKFEYSRPELVNTRNKRSGSFMLVTRLFYRELSTGTGED